MRGASAYWFALMGDILSILFACQASVVAQFEILQRKSRPELLDCFASLAMTRVSTAFPFRHCEEQSDEAIQFSN
jgi:hypothetical protein